LLSSTSPDQFSILGKGSLSYLGIHSAELVVWAISVTAEFDPSFDSAVKLRRPLPVRLLVLTMMLITFDLAGAPHLLLPSLA
jgi:hypothetical protein